MLANIHEHSADCRARHVYIADPGKWAGVKIDWFAVCNIEGWTFCPATCQSQPMFTRATGVTPLHEENGFVVVIERWPGIVFGGRSVANKHPERAPEWVHAAIKRQTAAWSKAVQADLIADQEAWARICRTALHPAPSPTAGDDVNRR